MPRDAPERRRAPGTPRPCRPLPSEPRSENGRHVFSARRLNIRITTGGKMDVVFGATGLVGGDIVRRLRAAGRSVRAGLRGGITHPKAEALMQAGVEVVEGDLTRAATLEGACQGAQTVVTTVTSMPTAEHDGLRRVD